MNITSMCTGDVLDSVDNKETACLFVCLTRCVHKDIRYNSVPLP